MKKKKPLNPRKKPIQGRSRVTVDAIYEAAAQVFSKNGYAETTTDRIAERAGVSIGSLYQYFPNKDSILLGLVERHIEEAQQFAAEQMQEIQGAGQILPEMTKKIIETAIAQHSINPELHRVLFEEAPRPESVKEMTKQVEDNVMGVVELMLQNNPKIRLKNPSVAARMIFTTVEALTHWYVLYGRNDFDRDVFINELTDMLNRYAFKGS